MIEYIPYFDIAALFLNLIVTIHYLGCKVINTRLTKQLNFFLIIASVSVIFDLISIYTINDMTLVPLWLNYFINETYIFSFNSCSMVYYGYLVLSTKDLNTFGNRKEKMILFLPVLFTAILSYSSSFTKFIIYFDETGYHHGPLFLLLYIVAYSYLILAMVHAIRYRKVLTRFQRIIVYFYIVFCFICVIIQQFYPEYLITEFAVSIAILLTYFSLENPMDFIDSGTGCLNRKAFFETIIKKTSRGKHFYVLGISIEGIKYITTVLGTSGADKIKKEVLKIILNETSKKNVFIHENRIAITDYKKDKLIEISKLIQNRFKDTFTTSEMNISLSCYLTIFAVPENASIATEIAEMLNFSLDKAVEEKSETIIETDSSIVQEMKREPLIAQILKQSINGSGFEIFYQPILNVKTGKFKSAEALIRLKDNSLKYISPEEFIPIAEKNGLIVSIGEYVLKEVCNFIREGTLLELGIKYIDVNLSPLQCLQENLSQRFLDILKEYGVRSEMINLEVTETATINSSTVLRSTMKSFIDNGIDFSLDDFGSGYANVSMMVDYPFSNIKLDKYMVWKAFENENSMKILNSIISMVHEIKMKVIAEGIETKEQADTLAANGCDFFQGYYYAKPMPKTQLLEFLKSQLQ